MSTRSGPWRVSGTHWITRMDRNSQMDGIWIWSCLIFNTTTKYITTIWHRPTAIHRNFKSKFQSTRPILWRGWVTSFQIRNMIKCKCSQDAYPFCCYELALQPSRENLHNMSTPLCFIFERWVANTVQRSSQWLGYAEWVGSNSFHQKSQQQ